jgi:hypothetical protein
MRLAGLGTVLIACGTEVPQQVEPPEGPPPIDLAAIPAGCADGRNENDRPDETSLDQIRALYVTTSDGPDFTRDTDGTICNSLRAAATWFHDQTGQFLRFDTTEGLIDIGFVRLLATDEAMRGTDPGNETIDLGHAFVRERIERALITAPNKLYAVYYEGTSLYACGGGAYPPLIIGRVGAMYLRAQPPGQSDPCDALPWGRDSLVPGYVDYGILHELVHSLGLVPPSSTNQHSSGHVFDAAASEPARDLMYSPRPAMPDPFWAVTDPAGLVIDVGSDDYYDTGTPDDLATSSLLSPLPANAHRPIGW